MRPVRRHKCRAIRDLAAWQLGNFGLTAVRDFYSQWSFLEPIDLGDVNILLYRVHDVGAIGPAAPGPESSTRR